MGILERDYMRHDYDWGQQSKIFDDRSTRSRFLSEFDLEQCRVTACLSGFFLISTVLCEYLWTSPNADPQFRDLAARLFTFNSSDIPTRVYQYLTHAFAWPGNLIQAGLMLGGLAFFGCATERRIGGAKTLVVFVAATVVGAWLQKSVDSPTGAFWQELIPNNGAPSVFADRVLATLKSKSPGGGMGGPGAAVLAFIVIAVQVRAPDERWSQNVLVLAVALAFISVDCLGMFRTTDVTYGSRFGGLVIGAAAAALIAACGSWRDRKHPK